MISFETAEHIIREKTRIFAHHFQEPSEKIPLIRALGRRLANPVFSPMDVPSFDNSAMDGFAVISEDTQNATPEKPVLLKIAGQCRAGNSRNLNSTLKHGTTIRIMTGTILPFGANTVVMKEKVTETTEGMVLTEPVPLNQNIRRKGEDIQKNNLAIEKGTFLNAGRVGFLASLGIEKVEVTLLPRVAILVTGDELVSSPSDLKPGKIFDSNSVFLQAALLELGMIPTLMQTLADDPKKIETACKQALNHCDVILLSGGVSVGDYDYTRPILKKLGVTEHFWKVAQKPGKPFCFGTQEKKLVFGMPGNPYAVTICFYLYIREALLTLMGHRTSSLPCTEIALGTEFKKKDQRTSFLKGRLETVNGVSMAVPLDKQGSHMLSSLSQTDVIIQIPAEASSIQKGEKVRIYFVGAGFPRP